MMSVEFGQFENWIMTQGMNEAWVRGKKEMLTLQLQKFERLYPTNFKILNFGVTDLLLIGSITYLPSLENIRERIILMAGVIALIASINYVNKKYLPFAVIYLGKKPKGIVSRLAPSLISWFIAVSAGITVLVLGAYLQGYFTPPPTP